MVGCIMIHIQTFYQLHLKKLGVIESQYVFSSPLTHARGSRMNGAVQDRRMS